MESSPERACPSCAAPADGQQRWCLECGGELPGPRRPGLRPAVGMATTLAVLVGAASAGGYTVLQEGKQPPPPATTVAQAPPAATAPQTLPPVTQAPAPPTSVPSMPSAPTPPPSSGAGGVATPPSSGSSTGGTNGGSTGSADGSVESEPEDPASTTPEPEPQLALTDIALGAAAVVYAPYAPQNADLGDASRTVDGSTRTVWKAPAAADPAASPQIGVYVDLAGKERIRKLVIDTPTPGMTVEIYGAVNGPPATITDAGWSHLADRS
ncbi:MAG TPA: hypothetical protein VK506_01240, partial [Conexibacter sp.]|nr:hypothetical protein [Conexibacter sp.]